MNATHKIFEILETDNSEILHFFPVKENFKEILEELYTREDVKIKEIILQISSATSVRRLVNLVSMNNESQILIIRSLLHQLCGVFIIGKAFGKKGGEISRDIEYYIEKAESLLNEKVRVRLVNWDENKLHLFFARLKEKEKKKRGGMYRADFIQYVALYSMDNYRDRPQIQKKIVDLTHRSKGRISQIVTEFRLILTEIIKPQDIQNLEIREIAEEGDLKQASIRIFNDFIDWIIEENKKLQDYI